MANFPPSLYQCKKMALLPYTLYMRHKFRDQKNGIAKKALELHYYRPSMRRFIRATMLNNHLLHEAELGPDSIVIDVGAYTGMWAQHMIDRYDPVIYAFEPNPQSFAKLAARAAANPKLHALSYGIGAEDATVEFTLNGTGSSMFEARREHADVPRVQVEIAAVDRVWRELPFDNVDLMKINIEGAEFPLLEKMIESDLLGKVGTFMVQFHEWHPGAYGRRRRIREALSKTHRLEWDYHFVWEKWVRA